MLYTRLFHQYCVINPQIKFIHCHLASGIKSFYRRSSYADLLSVVPWSRQYIVKAEHRRSSAGASVSFMHFFHFAFCLPSSAVPAAALQSFTSFVHQLPGVKRCGRREQREPRAARTATRVGHHSPKGLASLEMTCQRGACARLRAAAVPLFRSGLQQSLAVAFKGKPVFTAQFWCT